MAQIPQDLMNSWLEFLSREFKLDLSEQQLLAFTVFFSELEEWNRNINLVSYKTPEEVFFRHFADSLAVKTAFDRHLAGISDFSAADIGAGAGFPGIPLKIAYPGMKLTLIESVGKKCAFLKNISDKLNLQNVDIFNGRAELMGQDSKTREKYDITLSRAVTAVSPNLETALPLLRTGGFAFMHKYENFSAELDAAKTALEVLGGKYETSFGYRLPGGARESHILVFSKSGNTPLKYPRRPGMAEKKPI
ncbi:MAG: 16S rRNA (guanine(527)-N(7))-methyltransferase RsmG [Elusimicrobiota bacterium]